MAGRKKLPYAPWFWNDWESDAGIRALDYWDRGVWHAILGLMHHSEHRGYLMINGHPMDNATLAGILKLPLHDTDTVRGLQTTIDTLTERLGVASRCDKAGEPTFGALFNRRMVREEKYHRIFSESGKKGGNPAFAKGRSGNDNQHTPKPNPNPPPKPQYGDGDGNESGYKEKKKRGEGERKKKAANAPVYSEAFERFWAKYPRAVKKVESYASWLAILSTADYDEAELLARIEHALIWQKQSEQWTKDSGGHFIPLSTTYLNNHRWEDKPIEAPAAAGETKEQRLEKLKKIIDEKTEKKP